MAITTKWGSEYGSVADTSIESVNSRPATLEERAQDLVAVLASSLERIEAVFATPEDRSTSPVRVGIETNLDEALSLAHLLRDRASVLGERLGRL
jgi:predicted aminopeptidase